MDKVISTDSNFFWRELLISLFNREISIKVTRKFTKWFYNLSKTENEYRNRIDIPFGLARIYNRDFGVYIHTLYLYWFKIDYINYNSAKR